MLARLLTLACLLLLSLDAGAQAQWLSLPGARQQLIDEPVFGGRAWVFEAGPRDGPAVVLVHGLGDIGADTWQALVPALAERSRVLTFDLPGFGRSTKSNQLYSPENYVAFVRFVTQRYLGRPFKLVGHSMGGAIGLRYAASYPQDVSQLVLVDVAGILHRAVYTQFLSYVGVEMLPSIYPGQQADLADLAGRVLRALDRLNFDAGAVLRTPALRRTLLGGTPTQIAAMALVQEDFSGILPEVRTPTLIVWGEQDPIAPLRTGKLLASAIPGARLRVLPGLQHVPMQEDVALFNDLLAEELARDAATLTRLQAQAAYALAPEPPRDERIGRCSADRDRTFRGDYLAIEISGCRNVRLVDVRTTLLTVRGSEVEIENSHILGEDIGIRAQGSELKITGGSVRGDVAIELDRSRVDLAGVRVVGGRAALLAVGRQRSEAIFSVSWLVRDGRETARHEVRALRPNEKL